MSNKVDALQESSCDSYTTTENKRFCWIEWSLKPLIICLWFFGLPLQSPYYRPKLPDSSDSLSSSKKARWMYTFIRAFGMLLFCINSISSLTNLYNMTTNKRLRKGTIGWNDVINNLNFCLGLILVQSTLITSVTSTWNQDLLDMFNRIQNQIVLRSAVSSTKLRRIALAFSLLILLVYVTIYLVYVSFSTNVNYQIYGFTYIFGLFLRLRTVFITYLIIGAILFICLGRLVNILLDELGFQISRYRATALIITDQLLDSWRDTYQLICELIEVLNRCFGLMLVILLAFQFIWMVNSSFYCLDGFQNWANSDHIIINTLTNLGFEVIAFIFYTYIAYIPHSIKRQCHGICGTLRRLRPDDGKLQRKLNYMLLDMTISIPNISANGFFNIDLSLIPTIIGTTLTYLLILCQFQSSD